MFIFPRRRKRSENNFGELEMELERSLTPMSPSQEFIFRLRTQLMDQLGDVIQQSPAMPSRKFIFAAATFISGVIMLVMGIRMVMTLLAALAILQRIRQQT